MKFIRLICLILTLSLLMLPLGSVSAAQYSVSAGCRGVDARFPLGGSEKMLSTSKAVILYERTTGTLIYSYNADEQLAPSSMVKLMTALVALENGDLSATVTVTGSALNTVEIGSVSAGLARGEEMTLEDLLGCMMVAGANDAAAVIAEYIGGSQSKFVELMNEKAAELGCTGTCYADATGLNDTGNYTTVRDVLRILEAGLENEVFKTMFQSESWSVPATNKSKARTYYTGNYMMSKQSVKKYYDSRVTGGRTGATSKAGRCLAVTADVGNMELIGIVMGAKATYASDTELKTFGSFEEMDELLDYAQSGFELRQLFYENQVITQYAVENGGSNAAVTVADEVYCVLPAGTEMAELEWKYPETVSGLTAPVAKGQEIATLEVWYGDICLAETGLTAMTDVGVYEAYQIPQSSVNRQEEKEHGQVLAVIVGVILGGAVLVMVGAVVLRAVNQVRARIQLRRRRKERRRNRHA